MTEAQKGLSEKSIDKAFSNGPEKERRSIVRRPTLEEKTNKKTRHTGRWRRWRLLSRRTRHACWCPAGVRCSRWNSRSRSLWPLSARNSLVVVYTLCAHTRVTRTSSHSNHLSRRYPLIQTTTPLVPVVGPAASQIKKWAGQKLQFSDRGDRLWMLKILILPLHFPNWKFQYLILHFWTN